MGEPKGPDEAVARRPPTAHTTLATPPRAAAPRAAALLEATSVLPAGALANAPPLTRVRQVASALAPPPARRAAAARPTRGSLEFAEAQQIGRFGLIRELARGGMGQVFLARDTKLGRKVAIKFLLHDDPNFVSRFVIEARATARCTHDNIVTIFEVGEHQGLPFMVLEYLEGKTLSQLLETRMSVRAFAELMVPVARALERAHEHGIVHRDLKPSNIFVTDRGSVKVLDFGVAKCFDAPQGAELDRIVTPVSETKLMDTVEGDVTYVTFSGGGSLVGTLPYMSPEQWGADAVDFASDIWAVGIMFWRALTGVHPAGTMQPERLRAKLTDLEVALPSLASRDPSLPAGIVRIVDRCLAKKKAARYGSATELLADLQAFLQPAAVRGDDTSPYRGLAAFGEGKEAARTRRRVLIVVDQLEELFTLSADEVQQRTFLAALLAAADDPSAPVRVVLSMRADFLDRLAGHKVFLAELSRGLFFLSAPDLENLRETLVRPAELAGFAFESPDIVEDMLQTATSRGALPLLQFAATRMWDARDRPRKGRPHRRRPDRRRDVRVLIGGVSAAPARPACRATGSARTASPSGSARATARTRRGP